MFILPYFYSFNLILFISQDVITVKNFSFMPYEDTVYVLLSVNNKLKTNNDKPIDIVFDNFGFDLLETIS